MTNALAATEDHVVKIWPTGQAPHYRAMNPDVHFISQSEFEALSQTSSGSLIPVYNLGNNAINHLEQAKLMTRIPGVVILHDATLQHLAANWLYEELGNPFLYPGLMLAEYGESAVTPLRSHGLLQSNIARRGLWDTVAGDNFPLLGPFLRTAMGVVVHSSFQRLRVESEFAGPVLEQRLPWDYPRLFPDEAGIAAWQRSLVEKQRFRVVAYGHISRQKNLELLIEALVVNEVLRQVVSIVIMGKPNDSEYVAQLVDLARREGLSGVIEFRFSVTEKEARDVIMDCDVFYNFRRTSTEGFSGSVIEQMVSSRPVIVSDSGSFAELPDDACVRIPRASGAAAVASALLRLLADPEEVIRIGAAGRSYALAWNSADYVQGFRGFVEDLNEVVPKAEALGGFISVNDLASDDVEVMGPFPMISLPPEATQQWISYLLGPRMTETDGLRTIIKRSESAELWLQVSKLRSRLRWIDDYRTRGDLPQLVRQDEDVLFWDLVCTLKAEDVIYCCYFWLLGREPDELGLNDWLSLGLQLSGDVIVGRFASSDEGQTALQAERFAALRSRFV